MNDILSRQQSHSSRTAFLNYGGIKGDHHSLTKYQRHSYRDASIRVQSFWARQLALQGKFESLSREFPEFSVDHLLCETLSPAAPKAEVMVNSPTTAITLSRPATSESGQLASILQSVLSSLVERSQHADPPTAFLLSKDTHSISWGQSQKSLAVLRDVLKDASGNFRSMEQRRAADLILHTSASLFVVLPTGGGKTILIWLGVVKNRGKVVLVLVPLVSLKQDLLKRARDLGITAAGSTEDLKSSDSLLILVSDAALSSSGIAFVRRLKDNGRLS